MSIRIDKQGYYRDAQGRYASKADYEFQVNTEKAEKNLDTLGKKIQEENASLRDMQSELDKVQEKLNKVAKELNKEGMWNRISLTIKKVFAPFKKAYGYIKGIFGFLKKIASLTFGSLIKLFGLLWVWSKLGSVSGLNQLSQQGIGGGGTAGGSQAAQRADEVFGTTHYKHLYDNIQNISNNPNNWGALSILGLSDIREQLGTQDPAISVSMVMQRIADTIKDKYGGYQSANAQPIVTSALSQLGLDFAGIRAWDESGIKEQQDKYFKQQNKNVDGLVKIEQAYRKLQFQFTDLWRHFAVSLGPVVLKLSPIFIKFGHRLASWLSKTQVVEDAFESLYQVTKKVFEWLGTGGLDNLRKAMEWVRGFYKETLRPFGEKIVNWVNNNGGIMGIVDKVKNALTQFYHSILGITKSISVVLASLIDNWAMKGILGDDVADGIMKTLYGVAANASGLLGDKVDYNKYSQLAGLGSKSKELEKSYITTSTSPDFVGTAHNQNMADFEKFIKRQKPQEVKVTIGGTVKLEDQKGNTSAIVDMAKLAEYNNSRGGQ